MKDGLYVSHSLNSEQGGSAFKEAVVGAWYQVEFSVNPGLVIVTSSPQPF